MRRPFYLVIMSMLWLTLISPVGQAQDNLFLDIQTGFDAFYKVDTWVPVRVTIANQGVDRQAEIWVRDDSAGFSTANVRYIYPVDLPAQSRQQFTLYVPLRGQRQLLVEVVDSEGGSLQSVSQQIEPLEPDDLLVGVIAATPSLLNELAGLFTDSGDRVAVAHLTVEGLPVVPQAWAGLDVLVFNGVDTTTLSAAQQDALNHWVRRGGRLVVGGGPDAVQTIAGLNPLLPFTHVDVQTLPHPLAGLQNLTPDPLPDRGPYVAAIPANPTGRILLQEDNLPLILSIERGQGQVYYLALDLSLAPLDDLAAQPGFFPRLMGEFRPKGEILFRRRNWRDMQNSLALIPDQTLPTPGAITLYLCLYILAMGPLNYFILRRLKRREWAWFTIPAIILLFSSYGYLSGFRLRGGEPLMRQITVVQTTPGVSLASIISFVGIYSPFRADYNLQFDQTVLVESLPNAYGVGNELAVTSREATLVENLRSDIGGMPAIIAHSQMAAPQITADGIRYDQTSQRLQGTIINHTGQPISYASLVFIEARDPNSSNSVGQENLYHVVDLGTLPPGQTPVDRVAIQRGLYQPFYERNINSQEPNNLDLVSRDIAIRTMLGLNNNASVGQPRPAALYLAGWQAGSPLAVSLASGRGDERNDTLLLMSLSFAVNQ